MTALFVIQCDNEAEAAAMLRQVVCHDVRPSKIDGRIYLCFCLCVASAAAENAAKDEVLAAARELLEDTYLLRSMDGHEDDGGRNLCNGCDHVWGAGHSDGCRVGKLEAALATPATTACLRATHRQAGAKATP